MAELTAPAYEDFIAQARGAGKDPAAAHEVYFEAYVRPQFADKDVSTARAAFDQRFSPPEVKAPTAWDQVKDVGAEGFKGVRRGLNTLQQGVLGYGSKVAHNYLPEAAGVYMDKQVRENADEIRSLQPSVTRQTALDSPTNTAKYVAGSVGEIAGQLLPNMVAGVATGGVSLIPSTAVTTFGNAQASALTRQDVKAATEQLQSWEQATGNAPLPKEGLPVDLRKSYQGIDDTKLAVGAGLSTGLELMGLKFMPSAIRSKLEGKEMVDLVNDAVGGVVARTFKAGAKAGIGEASTEFAQTYPEKFAEGAGLSEVFSPQTYEEAKDAAVNALVGSGILGGAGVHFGPRALNDVNISNGIQSEGLTQEDELNAMRGTPPLPVAPTKTPDEIAAEEKAAKVADIKSVQDLVPTAFTPPKPKKGETPDPGRLLTYPEFEKEAKKAWNESVPKPDPVAINKAYTEALKVDPTLDYKAFEKATIAQEQKAHAESRPQPQTQDIRPAYLKYVAMHEMGIRDFNEAYAKLDEEFSPNSASDVFDPAMKSATSPLIGQQDAFGGGGVGQTDLFGAPPGADMTDYSKVQPTLPEPEVPSKGVQLQLQMDPLALPAPRSDKLVELAAAMERGDYGPVHPNAIDALLKAAIADQEDAQALNQRNAPKEPAPVPNLPEMPPAVKPALPFDMLPGAGLVREQPAPAAAAPEVAPPPQADMYAAAPAAAVPQPPKKPGKGTKIDPETDDLILAIRRLGGINVDLESDFKGRLNSISTPRIAGLPNVEWTAESGRRTGKQGRSADDLATVLHEHGYLANPDVGELYQKLWDAESKPQWSMQKQDYTEEQDDLGTDRWIEQIDRANSEDEIVSIARAAGEDPRFQARFARDAEFQKQWATMVDAALESVAPVAATPVSQASPPVTESQDLFPAADAETQAVSDQMALQAAQDEQLRKSNATQAPQGGGLFDLDNRQTEMDVTPAPERVYLSVPFAKKDVAKKAGAKWDADRKLWYAPSVPQGMESGTGPRIPPGLKQFEPDVESVGATKDVVKASAAAINLSAKTGQPFEVHRFTDARTGITGYYVARPDGTAASQYLEDSFAEGGDTKLGPITQETTNATTPGQRPADETVPGTQSGVSPVATGERGTAVPSDGGTRGRDSAGTGGPDQPVSATQGPTGQPADLGDGALSAPATTTDTGVFSGGSDTARPLSASENSIGQTGASGKPFASLSQREQDDLRGEHRGYNLSGRRMGKPDVSFEDFLAGKGIQYSENTTPESTLTNAEIEQEAAKILRGVVSLVLEGKLSESEANAAVAAAKATGSHPGILKSLRQFIETVQYSQGDTPRQGTTPEAITGILGESPRIQVHKTLADAEKATGRKLKGNAKAFVLNGKAHFIADRIAPGSELGVFLHEVGAHLGMERILSPELRDRLAGKIEQWAKSGKGVEGKAAQRAMEKAGGDRNELIAYFVEEAVNAGVNPTALDMKSDLGRWFRQLWAAMKTALRRFGVKNIDNLSAQDVVNFAYGAARLEMSGKWHGSAANFNKFSNSYRGTGEGGLGEGSDDFTDMIAFGQYFAGKRGTAEGYRDTMAARQNTLKNKQGGTLYNTDFNIADDEWLDWDKPLSEQSEKVKSALGEITKPKLYLSDLKNQQTADVIKNELYSWGTYRREVYSAKGITIIGQTYYANGRPKTPEGYGVSIPRAEFGSGGGLLNKKFPSVPAAVDAINAAFESGALKNMLADGRDIYRTLASLRESEKAASEYLNNLGIKGVRYLDGSSRRRGEGTYNYVVFDPKNVVIGSKNSPRIESDDVRYSLDSAKEYSKNVLLAIQDAPINVGTKAMLLLNNHQVADFYKNLPSAKRYAEAVDAMQAEAGKNEERIGALAERMRKLPSDMQNRLSDLMTKSTLEGVHVDKAFDDPANAHLDVLKGQDNVHAALQERYQALNPEAQAIYQEMRDHFAEMWKTRVKGVSTFADRIGVKGKAKAKLDKELAQLSRKVKGPYFPLMREGKYVVVWKSQAYLEAEKNEDTDTLDKLKESSSDYWVRFTDSEKEAKLLSTNRPERMADGAYGQFKLRTEASKEVGGAGAEFMSKLETALNERIKDKDTKEVALNALKQVFMETLPDLSVMKRTMMRRGVAGVRSDDMVRAIAKAGIADAHYLARLTHADRITGALQDLRLEDADPRPGDEIEKGAIGKPQGGIGRAYNLIAKSYRGDMMRPANEGLAWAANRLVEISYLHSLAMDTGNLIANMTQPALTVLPMLGGRHGFMKAQREMWRGLGDAWNVAKVMSYALDIEKVPNKNGERDALKTLRDMGVVELSMSRDLASVGRGDSLAYDSIRKFLATPAHFAETITRISSVLAAYRLELDHVRKIEQGMSEEARRMKAIHYAAGISRDALVDFTPGGAPILMKGNHEILWKTTMQYKRFAIAMLWLYGRTVRDSIDASNIKNRTEARKILSAMLFAQFTIAGGLAGLPAALPAKLVAHFWPTDDEDESAEHKLNRLADLLAGGNPEISMALRKGPLSALTGADLSRKMGLSDLMTLNQSQAFEPLKPNEKPGDRILRTVIPQVRVIDQISAGTQAISDGDLLGGVAKIMPHNFLTDLYLAREAAEKGMMSKDKTSRISPLEYQTRDLVAKSLGIPPLLETLKWEAAEVATSKERPKMDRREKALDAWVIAAKDGDKEAMDKAQAGIDKFNASLTPEFEKYRIKRQDQFSRKRSSVKGEKKLTETGIKETKRNKAWLPDLDIYKPLR